MSNAAGHVALDTLFRAQQRQPTRRGESPDGPYSPRGTSWERMDEERRAYLEQERLLQRQQARKPTVLARARIIPVAQSR